MQVNNPAGHLEMILIFFFASLCLPFHHCATSTSMPKCSESFYCGDAGPFMYPFYNATGTDTHCDGLMEVNCTSNHGEVKFGGRSYEITGKYETGSSVSIHNTTFEELLANKSCEVLMYNFTSPTPNLFLLGVPYNLLLTLFKCTKDPDYAMDIDAYFNQPNYKSYNNCTHHNFYYKYHPMISDAEVPSDLPHPCEVIQRPVMVNHTQVPDHGNLFSLLTPIYTISFWPPSCAKCYNEGWHHCHLDNQKFKCLYEKKGKPFKGVTILILGLSVGVMMMLITTALCSMKKLKWRIKAKNDLNVEILLNHHELFLSPKRYTYSQIKKMTNSFYVKLGQGGFGSVYRGSLSNGDLVAVKILSEVKGNGEDFVNEVASVGRTAHVNIVRLVGFCLEGNRRALIYEFMPNGSLERFIYGQGFSISKGHLGWEKRHQIAIGIARGLEYLHKGCNTQILHFDIKPHNILLDKDFCPKISDFGLAKLFPDRKSIISMSDMRGTPGYIAPELFSRSFGGVSHKSDVYSYGMMILEMVGGRKNIEVGVDRTSEIYFPHWIYKKIQLHEEQLGLHGIVSDEENVKARKMIIVGLWCIQTNPLSRPTITKALEMLEGDLAALEIPPKPYLHSPSRSSDSSTMC